MTEYYDGYELKDSGKRQEFNTGSVRDTREGKGRYDLITPFGLAEVAVVYEKGADKYSERNWEKGQPLGRYLDSAKRHIDQVLMGKTDENHAAHAAWNLLGFIHTRKMIEMGVLSPELNDLPDYTPRTDSYNARDQINKEYDALDDALSMSLDAWVEEAVFTKPISKEATFEPAIFKEPAKPRRRKK